MCSEWYSAWPSVRHTSARDCYFLLLERYYMQSCTGMKARGCQGLDGKASSISSVLLCSNSQLMNSLHKAPADSWPGGQLEATCHRHRTASLHSRSHLELQSTRLLRCAHVESAAAIPGACSFFWSYPRTYILISFSFFNVDFIQGILSILKVVVLPRS